MRYTKILTSVALASLLSVGFTACSDSDSGSGSTSSTAYYLDSAVEGVEYDNGRGLSGETNAEGAFKFQDGDTVTFKIGGLLLRAQSGFTNGQKFVETDDNVITLLQSIDADGDASNGITITPIVKEQLAIWLDGATSVEINATDGKLNNIDELISALEAEGLTPEAVTVEDAREHVEETIKEAAASDDTKSLGDQTIVGDTIHYIDYKDEVRSSELSAAAAEYHTGTGYGNTLFGSADKKCQNCHNELYDTWKGSMHGKSWTDPIFQSKFQDFLRTHLNKIGQHPNSDGDLTTTDDGIEYTEAKFKGAAQTCIKCHAPGAYYAGDVSVSLTKLKEGSVATQDLVDAKALHEVTDPNGEIAVVAANSVKDVLYKATFQIGHEANREGINCAFCHSIETPRLMGVGNDGNSYTLANAMRVGPHGPLKGDVGDVFTYDVNASNADMNKFFRLWGPEKYTDYANTPKNAADFDAGKSKDGRYTMHSIDLNGTDGKVHFTGGPFYGPYGVTGVSNENATDETDRAAHVNPHFDVDNNNHFGESGKGLCLSCHQRSAGAAVPGGEEGAGMFMELCSTQIAVSTGGDSGSNDSLSSPKCQKCHMERIEGTVLHQWARPDKLWTLADNPALTGHFDPEDPDAYGEDNPVAAGWLNSHAFLG
ncbi:MAG: multiheme c-type cytochrome, partial [Campylobacterota bacterium]|nr:multiheme c-type cytochrome [Campylobacterota bacterium]